MMLLMLLSLLNGDSDVGGGTLSENVIENEILMIDCYVINSP